MTQILGAGAARATERQCVEIRRRRDYASDEFTPFLEGRTVMGRAEAHDISKLFAPHASIAFAVPSCTAYNEPTHTMSDQRERRYRDRPGLNQLLQLVG